MQFVALFSKLLILLSLSHKTSLSLLLLAPEQGAKEGILLVPSQLLSLVIGVIAIVSLTKQSYSVSVFFLIGF